MVVAAKISPDLGLPARPCGLILLVMVLTLDQTLRRSGFRQIMVGESTAQLFVPMSGFELRARYMLHVPKLGFITGHSAPQRAAKGRSKGCAHKAIKHVAITDSPRFPQRSDREVKKYW